MIEYSNSQVSEIIDEYIHSEIGRKIMKRRLIDGIFFEELSSEFNYSVRQIKNIVYKYEKVIYSHLQ